MPAKTPRTNLKSARESANMTQRQLARAARCTTATIGDMESGRNREPSHTKVVRIVRALNRSGLPDITADDLFMVPEVRTAPQLPGRQRRPRRGRRS